MKLWLLLSVFVCLCILLTKTEAETDTISELRQKTARISAELEGYKNAVAGLSPHLKGLIRKEVEASQTCVSSSVGGTCVKPDKKKKSKGAKVTINIGEGFGSNNKINLNDDFNCPTGSDTSTWIETVQVNNVTDGLSSLFSTGEVYSPAHFVINQTNRRRASIGSPSASYSNRRRRGGKTKIWSDKEKEVFYDGNADKKVNNWEWFPGTLKVMRDRGRGHPEEYFKGIFQGSGDKFKRVTGEDWEQTSWWEIDGGACYAMAAYIAMKVDGDKKFLKESNKQFAKYASIRTLKFSLCKKVGNPAVPKCAVRKMVLP